MIEHNQKLLILQSTCSIIATAYECAHNAYQPDLSVALVNEKLSNANGNVINVNSLSNNNVNLSKFLKTSGDLW